MTNPADTASAERSTTTKAGGRRARSGGAMTLETAPPLAWMREASGAVFWGFFGVRKCKAMARDVRTLKPAQVIVAGIVFAAMLVLTLLAIVRLITGGA